MSGTEQSEVEGINSSGLLCGENDAVWIRIPATGKLTISTAEVSDAQIRNRIKEGLARAEDKLKA